MVTLERIIIRGYEPFLGFFDRGFEVYANKRDDFDVGLLDCYTKTKTMTEQQAKEAKNMNVSYDLNSQDIDYFAKYLKLNGFDLIPM